MYNILIDKMKVVNSSPVEYYFYFDESWKSVNELIGKKIIIYLVRKCILFLW